VSQYCGARDGCQGPVGESIKGDKGDKGDTGEKGDQGEPGPGPTPEQIQAAVANYCETEGCSGSTTITLQNCEPESGMVVTGISSSGDPEIGYTLTCTKEAQQSVPGGIQ
jgi:hypothetical protein